jgi:putative NADH-flavin reductase
MTKHKVLLLGATGSTGFSILTSLLESGKFVSHPSQLFKNIPSHPPKQEVTALIRPSSAKKPEVQDLIKRGIKILIADILSPPDELGPLLSGTDIFISAISGFSIFLQKT